MVMAYFPFFIDIENEKGLIAGGGRIAAHKVEKLLPFGARLTVIAPRISSILKENPAVTCLEREFLDSDVEGSRFVIAASDDVALNHHISALCREKGILVNVVDDKDYCGFLFPALVKEGKLTAGICTAGASPQTAASVRSRLAAELPGQTEAILENLNDLRDAAKERIADDRKRAAFLKDAAKFCLAQNRPLTDTERENWLAEYEKVDTCEEKTESGRSCSVLPEGTVSGGEAVKEENPLLWQKNGSVTLAGAGCGAYDLITLRGLNALRNCDVLIYDDLIDERLLDHVSESCEKIYVGKRRGAHSRPQEEINALLVEKAKEGKRVVRLKGGDPFVFGRGAEEIEALRREKIEVLEIPGITSAIAVPAAAGIPVTNRGMSRSFHVVTAHTSDTEDCLPKDLENLAKSEGTCIFLMGLHQLGQIAERLLAYGKAPDTPAAVVHGNFDGTVQAVRGTLADIAEKAKMAQIEAPAVIVVGETAGLKLLS